MISYCLIHRKKGRIWGGDSMHVMVVGLNYRTAPVEVREKFVFQADELPRANYILRNTKSILECIIVSTCNRMELYAVVDQEHPGSHMLKAFLSSWFGIPVEQFSQHLYIHVEDDAIRHLFRVTTGLDSMVLGETQILGQIRDAFQVAQQNGSTGSVFNTLFKQAITLAKRAHSETEISQNAVSVSYAAIELGKKIFGTFAKKRVLLIGAGKMSELTATHLNANGVADVMVINRTLEKAQEMAQRFNGTALPWDQLVDALLEADIVISSTSATKVILRAEDVRPVMKRRQYRPLFMIDIAVPRDLDPVLQEIEGVFLYDIDDLEGIVEANLKEREHEAAKIEVMIEEEIEEFQQWLEMMGVVPVLAALREKANSIYEETMRSLENKLPDLSERERKQIRKHSMSIINQLLKDPIIQTKELAGNAQREERLQIVSQMFGIEEQVVQKQRMDAERRRLAAEQTIEMVGLTVPFEKAPAR